MILFGLEDKLVCNFKLEKDMIRSGILEISIPEKDFSGLWYE
jgi:hypothetical protein